MAGNVSEDTCKVCSVRISTDSQIVDQNLNRKLRLISNLLYECYPELDLHLNKKTILCRFCFKEANKYYQFKNQCRTNEEEIYKHLENISNQFIPFTDNNKEFKVHTNNLFYSAVTGSRNTNCSIICRICLILIKDDSITVSIDFAEVKMNSISVREKLFWCFSELDLRINPNAVLCRTCLNKVDRAYQFKNKYTNKYLKSLDSNDELCLNVKRANGRQEIISSNNVSIINKVSAIVNNGILTSNISNANKHLCKYSNKYNTKHKFDMHLRHRKKTVHRCRYCNDCAKPEVVFKCVQCIYNTNKKTNLMKHLKIHGKNLYECSNCTYSTNRKDHLDRHSAIHDNKELFQCTDCKYNTSRKGNLVKHLIIHEDTKPFQCSICNYVAKRKRTLSEHLRTHTDGIPLKCLHCEYSTKRRRNLIQHLNTHKDQKPFNCLQCSYRTRVRLDLEKHIFIHSAERPFKCPQCDYKAKQKTAISQHILAHSDAKPFKCLHCEYQAKRKTNLIIHVRIHKTIKHFKCLPCKYKTRWKAALNKHISNHKDDIKLFKCIHCEYSTIWRANLINHIHIHSEEKRFKCPHCDYRAKQKSAINQHIPVHRDEKQFKCPHCNYSSRWKINLMNHMYVHAE